MTDVNWFWHIISLANRNRAELLKILSGLSDEEIYAFQNHFVELSAQLLDEHFITYMESSEDGQEDIAHWIVSGGKEYYLEIINDPPLTPFTVEGKNNGNLYGVANEVFYKQFGKQMDIY